VTVIRVNPESVRAYASQAQGIFDGLRAELEGLVNEVVSVRYYGPNAAQFKTQAGEMASAFSSALLADLGAISEAVSSSTSAIASSLGGAPVRIAVNGSPVVGPAVDAGDGSVDVDTSALEGLTPVVAGRFGSIDAGLDSHLRALEATDWEGNAKIGAMEQVSGFTRTAQSRTAEARENLTRFITDQIASVTAADR
jgi:ABC-type transporter Mla subunit MlaD